MRNWIKAELPVSLLHVDKRYQRDLNELKVSKIIEEFDIAQVREVFVSQRDNGTYWILDGQHTVEALKRLEQPIANVACRVFTGLTYQEEADLFYKLNTNSRKATFNDVLKANYESGNTDAVRYFNLLNRIQVPYIFKGDLSRGLKCHNTCFKIMLNSGENILSETLSILYSAFGTYGMDVSIISGLATFIRLYENHYDKARLLNCLSKYSVDEMKKTARMYGNSDMHGITNIPMASAIIDIYNKNLRSGKIDKSKLIK